MGEESLRRASIVTGGMVVKIEGKSETRPDGKTFSPSMHSKSLQLKNNIFITMKVDLLVARRPGKAASVHA